MEKNNTENLSNYKYQFTCNSCGYTFESNDLTSNASQQCPNCGGKFEFKILSSPTPKYSKDKPYPHYKG